LEKIPTPLLILLAVVLLLVPMIVFSIGGCGLGFGYSSYPTEIHFGNDNGSMQNITKFVRDMKRMERQLAPRGSFVVNPVPLFFAQIFLLAGIALIVYAIVRSATNRKDGAFKEYCESFQPPIQPSAPLPGTVPPITSVAFNQVTLQVVRKRPTWLLLLAAFVSFSIGSWMALMSQPDLIVGFFILSFWAMSFGLFMLYIIIRVIGNEYTQTVPLEPVTQADITYKRIVAGILGILLGYFGVHKFYLGFIGTGLCMLILTVCSLFLLFPVMAIIGFVEGILYLLKSDRDFYRDYEVRRRNWF
jgi:TM2 domain-containing membrane protein YozV